MNGNYIKTCVFCGKEYKGNPSKPNQRFCTNDCLRQFYRHKYLEEKTPVLSEERDCAYCGKRFVWISSKPKQKYCSKDCAYNATRENIRKKQRKKKEDELTALKQLVELNVESIFKKKDETNPASVFDRTIDSWNVYGFNENLKRKVKERDGYKCQTCFRTDSLEVHHILKRSLGGEHKEENLVTLCTSCHRAIETDDKEHAKRKCFINAKKFFMNEKEETLTDSQLLYQSLSILKKVFNEITENNQAQYYSELLISVSDAIENLEVWEKKRNRELNAS